MFHCQTVQKDKAHMLGTIKLFIYLNNRFYVQYVSLMQM
jgi:hypothetical protein